MKKYVQIVLGLLLAAFFLWWAFRGMNVHEVLAAMRGIRWFWLGVALAGIVATFFTRILRWRYIVRTAKFVSFRSMFSSTQIGFLANFVLPGRAGEVIRALVLSRMEQLPFSKCFAFVALDRVTDLFGLVAVMLLSVLTFHPVDPSRIPAEAHFPDWAMALLQPQAIRAAAVSAILALTALVGIFVLLYVNQRLALRIADACAGAVSKRLVGPVHRLIEHFAEGLKVFRSAGDMAKSVFFSLITWTLFAIVYQSMLYAFGLNAPWYASFLVWSLVAVAISMPGAPGFIGQFHAAILVAMVITMPEVKLDVARAIAIVTHLLNLIPVTVVGVACLYLEGFGLVELRRQSESSDFTSAPAQEDEPQS